MNKNKNLHIAVLIPAYNETNSIREVVQGVLQHIDSVIVIDDGSTDDTVEKIQNLSVTILQNSTNRGKDASLLRGFAHTIGSNIAGIITIDADQQHDPDDIPRLIAAIRQYPEKIIIAARLINRDQAPKQRLLANKLADFFISWAAGHKIIDSQSGFRFYPQKFIEQYVTKATEKGRFLLESSILIDADHAGFTTAVIPIRSHYPKQARQSYYRGLRDSMRIASMLAKKLARRFFNLPGLIRAIFTRGIIINS